MSRSWRPDSRDLAHVRELATLRASALWTVWRRCSLVAERCGYAPRSRLAIRPQTALARTVPIYETASRGRRVCAASVYGFSAGEMRKIAHNLHAKEKEEIASGRARKFRGSI